MKVLQLCCLFLVAVLCVESRSSRQTVRVVPAGYTTRAIVVRPGGGNVNGISGWIPYSGSTTRTLWNGTKACDCWDIRSGAHTHGSVWYSGGAWKLVCNNGTMDVLACITNSGKEIQVNTTVTIDGFWHKCVDDGAKVRYTQEKSCTVNGKRIHINDTFPTDAFRMKCEEWGYSIVGCVYRDANNVERELNVGQVYEDQRWRHSCMPVPQVEGRVKYEKVALGCEYDGKFYKKGENWVAKNMNHVCNDYGSYRITNCVSDTGQAIPIGQTLIENNLVQKCYRSFNGVYFQSYSCGAVRGTSCQGGIVPYFPQPRRGGGNGITFVIPQGGGNSERVFHKRGGYEGITLG